MKASIHLPMHQKLYLGFRLAMRYPELDQDKFVGEGAAI